MNAKDLVIYSAILYALRIVPCIIFLLRYHRTVGDPVANFYRIIMIALIIAIGPRVLYLFDPQLLDQLQRLVLPRVPAWVDLFGNLVWCIVAWWLYLLFVWYTRNGHGAQ